MKRKRIAFVTVIVLLCVALLYFHTQTERLVGKYEQLAEQPPSELPYKWVGNIEERLINEPSGIAYHPGRDTLFVVGDEGDLYEMRTDGRVVRSGYLKGKDLEGITVNPETGLLYAVVEGDDAVIEIRPETFRVTRRFEIDRTFEGRELLKKGGMGLEAIAFVPDSGHPEGGSFWVGNQSFKLKPGSEPSIICEVVLPIRSTDRVDAKGTIVRFVPMNMIDVSGLQYDALRDVLLVISDTTNLLVEVGKGGELLHRYLLPGDDQEGITLDEKGYMYIAQESRGVIKIEDRRTR